MNFNFSLSCSNFAPATPLYQERRRRFIAILTRAAWNFLLNISFIDSATLYVNARNYSRSTSISLRNFHFLNPHRVNARPFFASWFTCYYKIHQTLSSSYFPIILCIILNKLFFDHLRSEWTTFPRMARNSLVIDRLATTATMARIEYYSWATSTPTINDLRR